MDKKNQNVSQLNDMEQKVIKTYRRLTPIQKIAVRAYILYGDNRLLLRLLE